jgi:hypothetical protein
MAKLEEVYKRLEKNKKAKRDIGKMLKDELTHSSRYQEIVEEMKTLREEKKGIEQDVRAGSSDFDKIDGLKLDIQTDSEILADVTLNMYTKDENVEIIDEYDQAWYPVFKVNFKKGN